MTSFLNKSAPGMPGNGALTSMITIRTADGKGLLQSERMATLMIEVLRSFVSAGWFKVHEFVVMRNYVQLLITVGLGVPLEEAVAMIQGRFAYRAVHGFKLRGWIWAKDFTQVVVQGRSDFLKRQLEIQQLPVKAGLAASAREYPYGSLYLRQQKAAPIPAVAEQADPTIIG